MKYIAITSIISAVFLFCVGVYYKNKATSFELKYNTVNANNGLLIGRLKESYEDNLAISKQNEELKQMAKEDKSGFDWNFDISNTDVVKQLRKN